MNAHELVEKCVEETSIQYIKSLLQIESMLGYNLSTDEGTIVSTELDDGRIFKVIFQNKEEE